jgi:hypothetical protein
MVKEFYEATFTEKYFKLLHPVRIAALLEGQFNICIYLTFQISKVLQ